MKKQLSILQTFLVTCLLLVIGGGSSWAQETYSIDFESASSDYSDWIFTNMLSQQSGAISAHGGSCYGTTGGKSTASIVTNSAIASPASITFYVSKQSDNTKASNWKIQVSSDSKTWTDVKTQSATSMSKGSWVEVTQDLSSYSDVYVRIYYTGSTAVRNIDDVTLSTGIQKTVSSLDVSGSFTDLWQGDDFNKTGIKVIATYTDKTEEDVTSKCSCTGYDMNTAGDQTVSISYGEVTVQKAATVQTIANTEETAYTATQAKSLIDAGKGLNAKVYVKGVVSEIVTEYSSSYGNISFNVSADGTTSGDQLQLFRNIPTEGGKYTSASDCPAVGDEVVGCGTLTKYNSTYELNAGNYIVSLKRKTDFTIENAAVKNGETITPVVTTNIPGTYTITYVSDNSSVVVYSDGALKAVGVGSAQVTATISADGYRTASTTFEVTVTTNASLSSIAISGAPTKTEYFVGESFDTEGLIVTATYSDASSADITSVADFQIDPATFTSDGNIEVSVQATFNKVSSVVAKYSVTVSKKNSSISIADIAIEKGKTFTIAATTTPENAPLTYTILNGESVISIEGNDITALAAGEATVRADYAGSSEYKGTSTEFNVIVSAAVTINLTKDETTTATADQMTWVNDVVTIKSIRTSSSTTAANNYYPGSSGKNYSSTRFYENNTLSFTPMNDNTIKFVVYEATTVEFATKMANSTWTNATTTVSGMTVTITPINGGEEFSATIGATTGGKSFNIVYTEPVRTSITLPGVSDGLYYGTYSNNNSNVKITVDEENIVEVSTVAVLEGQLLKTERTDGQVAKGEGVLICSTTPNVTVTNISTSVTKDADNNLVATPFVASTDGEVGYKYYRMTYNNTAEKSGLGFYWGAADGAAFDVAAEGKAILKVSEEESSGAKGFSFIWDDTNAIRDIEVAPVDSNAIYNMQGQRVNASAKGLLIKNGKKYISK